MPALSKLFYIWLTLIFLLSACGRSIQTYLRTALGPHSLFLFIVLGLSCALFILLCVLWKRSDNVSAIVSVVVSSIVFGLIAYSLRKNPEEAFHLFEYGILSFLATTAISNRPSDIATNIAAAFFVGGIGICEELFQWILPHRIFDFRDIGINLIAASLVQLCLIGANSNLLQIKWYSLESLNLLRDSVASFILTMSCCLFLTPDRILSLTHTFPALSLLENEPVINYGYKHQVDSWISFSSCFQENELREMDLKEGGTISKILGAPDLSRMELRRQYSELRYPFLYEAEFHISRRNHYLKTFLENASDTKSATIAFAEQKIISNFFSLSSGDAQLDERIFGELVVPPHNETSYMAPSNTVLITTISRTTVEKLLFLMLIGLGTILYAQKFRPLGPE